MRLLSLSALVLIHCGNQASVDDLAVADLAVAADLAVLPDLSAPDLSFVDGAPACTELRCTGLYSDWATLTVDSAVREYTPTYTLWSDGAKKRRFLYLPPGTQIDVSDMNAWSFPVGTKLWKEFQLNIAGVDTRIETRLLWKTDPTTWVMTTYAWSSDGSTATELLDGMLDVPGTNHYEIPSANAGACAACHNGRADKVLGFEAISLAQATPLGWTDLQTSSLLTSTNGNHSIAASALAMPGTAVEKAAIGYMHANCGNACHHPSGPGPFSLRVDIANGKAPATVADTTAFAAINAHSGYVPTGSTGNYYRIRPTDPAHSTIPLRMNVRGGYPQMPPLDTHVVDSDGLAAVNAWINAMTAAPYPTPSPL